MDILDELGETSSTVLPSIHTVSPLVVDDGKPIMFASSWPNVIFSNLPFLSSVMFYLKDLFYYLMRISYCHNTFY